MKQQIVHALKETGWVFVEMAGVAFMTGVGVLVAMGLLFFFPETPSIVMFLVLFVFPPTSWIYATWKLTEWRLHNRQQKEERHAA